MKTKAWTPPPPAPAESDLQEFSGYPLDLSCTMFVNGVEMMPAALAVCMLQALYQVRAKGQFRIIAEHTGEHLMSLNGSEVTGVSTIVDVFMAQNTMSAAFFELMYADIERAVLSKQQNA